MFALYHQVVTVCLYIVCEIAHIYDVRLMAAEELRSAVQRIFIVLECSAYSKLVIVCEENLSVRIVSLEIQYLVQLREFDGV